MSVSLTGQDTVQIDGRIINDLADQDPFKLTFPEDVAKAKVGKNGNIIYAQNNMGFAGEVEIRILLGSSDDKYLTARMSEQFQDFSSFILLTGNFNKRVGDGAGNLSTDVYAMLGGIFKKQVEAKTSAEGDTEQSVAVYTITFGNVSKSVQ